jgi:KaiC/GvpD/RAD55 family RecA-like ATPase
METGNGQESREELISKLREMRNELRKDISESMNALRDVEAEIERIFPPGIEDQPISENTQMMKYAKTGTSKLDDLLNGGFSVPSNVLVNGPPFSSKDILINSFIVKSIEEELPVIVILIDKDIYTIREELSLLTENLEFYEKDGTIRYIDTYSKAISAEVVENKAMQIDSIATNQSGFLKTIDQLNASLNKSHGKCITVVYSLTGWIQSLDEKLLTKTLQHFSQKRKLDGGVAIYSLDSGLFSDQIYERMNYFMDSAIEFKLEESREFLRARGFKNPRTKEWVDIIPKGRLIDLGSFNIRRVR